MSAAVFWRGMRETWRGMLGWTAGIAAVILLYLPLYPSFAANGQLDELVGTLPPQLAEALGFDEISTGAGYTQSSFYALTGFLLLVIAAVVWGSAALAGAEESGRLELDLAHGISRVGYASAAVLAVLVRMLWLGLFSGLLIWALNGPSDLGIHPPHLVGATAALTGLAFLSAAAALFAGALTGRRLWATGVGAAVAVLGYVLNAVAKQSVDLEWMHAISPYSWAFRHPPLSEGADPLGLLAVWGVSAILCIGAAAALSRRDITGA